MSKKNSEISIARLKGQERTICDQDGSCVAAALTVSEIMYLDAFFWLFVHSCLSSTTKIGAVWPPSSIARR